MRTGAGARKRRPHRILETVVTTRDDRARDHIAPMGIRQQDGFMC